MRKFDSNGERVPSQEYRVILSDGRTLIVTAASRAAAFTITAHKIRAMRDRTTVRVSRVEEN